MEQTQEQIQEQTISTTTVGEDGNSEVIVDAKYSRFKSAPWFGKQDVIIGGAGGIGSHLTFLLTRAGFNCTVYDMDTIERHNLSGQLFAENQVGQKKTDALKAMVRLFTGESIDTADKYDFNSMSHNYVFSAFDNIEARRIMFTKWEEYIEQSGETGCFIDGRLLFEQLIIHCISSHDYSARENYLRHELFSDDEVDKVDCTLKQTTHTASMIASHMVGFFTNFLRSKNTDIPLINFPAKWEYSISIGLITQ